MKHLLPLLLILATSFAEAEPVPANADCSTLEQTNDSLVVGCTIPVARAVEFVARFSGGHDDTDVSIEPMLDGRPAACGEKSKLSSHAEDGDLVLSCLLVPGADTPTGAKLTVTIRFSHARYVDHALRIQVPRNPRPS